MTISGCPRCNYKGTYRVQHIPPPRLDAEGAMHPPTCDDVGRVKVVFCSCALGQQLAALQNRMNHPEYENPFLKMTNKEILKVLDKASENQAAIEAEFNLD